MKWIPRSKSRPSKSRRRWAAHTRIGNVWEVPPPPGQVPHLLIEPISHFGLQKKCETPNLTSFLGLLKQTHEIGLNSLNAESEKWKPLGVSSAT